MGMKNATRHQHDHHPAHFLRKTLNSTVFILYFQVDVTKKMKRYAPLVVEYSSVTVSLSLSLSLLHMMYLRILLILRTTSQTRN